MRILCIDDEPLMRQMLEMAVKEARPDDEVHVFERQGDLVKSAEEGGCDVALIDIHMRGLNGVDLAKLLKMTNPKMNIIFVTGFSEYAGEAMKIHASGYIMKPVTAEKIAEELSDLRFPIVPKQNALLRVQCFGNFDVFTPDGKPVHFERSKAKEIFAYLVHRHGSTCTTREIAAALFEDAPYDKSQQSYLRTLISVMVKTMKGIGAEEAIVKGHNAYAVNPDVLDCDYYRFAELDAGAVNAYQNEYMSQYYWAEFFFDDF